MLDFPQRARKKLDLASLLKICPQCLGDLVARSDFAGDYYSCLQCNVRTEPRNRIGRLPDLPLGIPQIQHMIVPSADSRSAADPAPREILTG
jgi:hypothetical protein